MSIKKKLITTISAFCLVTAILLVGVWALKTTSFDIGGNISFTATGINATISKGTLSSTGSWVTPDDADEKLKEIVINTDKTQTQINSEFVSWQELNLLFNENADDVTITFSITNDSEVAGEYIWVDVSINNGTMKNAIASISTTSTTLAPNETKEFVITFKVLDKTANASLSGFNLHFDMQLAKDGVEASTLSDLAFTYDNSTMTASVKGNNASATSITIPDYVINEDKLYAVTFLENSAFYNYSALEKLVLPNTLKSVGYLLFNGCSSLQVLKEDGARYLGSNENPYLLMWGVTDTTISSFTNFKDTTKILYGTFQGCSNLTSIELPNHIQQVGYASFSSTAITDIVIPNGVQEIGVAAFQSTTTLKTVSLPSTLTLIDVQAFCYCSALEEVVIPNSVNELRTYAFYGCTNLSSVTLPQCLTSIPQFCFDHCTTLKSIDIPSTVKVIDAGAFQYCSSLTSLTLPAGLEYIGDFAFNHCYGLTNETIKIPAGIKQIGGRAYDPENPSKTIIGTHVFYNCATNALKSFELDASNEYYMVVDGVLYRKENGVPTVLVAYPADKRDVTYTMPDTVVNAYELSLSRPFYLREIVLSDNFIIKEMEGGKFNNASYANNLHGMIYIYSGVTTITCKDTNPNYMSYNGQVYSKDGTILYYAPVYAGILYSSTESAILELKAGVTTIFFGSLGMNIDIAANILKDGTNPNEDNQFKTYDKVIIPASVTTIPDGTIAGINAFVSWEIEVESGNTAFQVNADGDLERITTA